MNLADIKQADFPKRTLFQIERSITRAVVDRWCKDNAFFDHNFARYVEVDMRGRRITTAFSHPELMVHGSPESTVNDVMRGLILTMCTDQRTGALLPYHEAILGNIIDVFVHRLREVGERKFLLRRLQSLDLGFSIAFGLGRAFYPIRKDRRYLERVLTVASMATPPEAAEALIHDIHETEALAEREHGVTFHIFMKSAAEASFISLPLGQGQAAYVPLLGTHALRCNILSEMAGRDQITGGIMKIDAPSKPMNFLYHKGVSLDVSADTLMRKLENRDSVRLQDFSADEQVFLQLLFNEYVQLACFLLDSGRIDAGLRLLIIFPRANIFLLLHNLNEAIPPDEPLCLGALAALRPYLFAVDTPGIRKSRQARRISETVIPERVFSAMHALARHILRHVYKPVSEIKRALIYYAQQEFGSRRPLDTARGCIDEISAYLKTLRRIRRIVFASNGRDLDLEACLSTGQGAAEQSAQDEIASNIQLAEIEQTVEVIVSKMLDYLSFVTAKLEQIQKVSSPHIKQQLAKEIDTESSEILSQATAFHRMMTGRARRYRS